MKPLALLLVCAATIASVAAQPKITKGPAPALPYYDWKACPFEGCAYRQWTARSEVAVYDTYQDNRKQIAKLSKGDKVTAVTGVVITFQPGVIHLDRDYPEAALKRGDTILTYTYQGEGFSSVWFQGQFISEFDISFAKWPDGSGCGGAHCAATYVDLGKKVWWVQVDLASGRTGWVELDHAQFDGTDLLARTEKFGNIQLI
jgi:hypothetical protein